MPRVGIILVLYWRASINLTVEGSDKHYIDAVIDKNTENKWRLTGFYSEPNIARRHEAWDKLSALNSRLERSWMCYGNFNEIIRRMRKSGE